MDNEMEVVSLDLMVFKACGRKEEEVNTAADNPMTGIQFMIFSLMADPGREMFPDMDLKRFADLDFDLIMLNN